MMQEREGLHIEHKRPRPHDSRHRQIRGERWDLASTGSRAIVAAAAGAGIGSVFGATSALVGALLCAVIVIALAVAHLSSTRAHTH